MGGSEGKLCFGPEMTTSKILLLGELRYEDPSLQSFGLWLSSTSAHYDAAIIVGRCRTLASRVRSESSLVPQTEAELHNALQFLHTLLKIPLLYVPCVCHPEATLNLAVKPDLRFLNLHKQLLRVDESLVLFGMGECMVSQSAGSAAEGGEASADFVQCFEQAIGTYGPSVDYVCVSHYGPLPSLTTLQASAAGTSQVGSKTLAELLMKHQKHLLCNVHGNGSRLGGLDQSYGPISIITASCDQGQC